VKTPPRVDESPLPILTPRQIAERLSRHVVVYSDATVAAPLIFAYALSTRKKRKPKRLFKRLPELYDALRKAHMKRHPGSDAMPELRDEAKTHTVGPGRAVPRR